MCAAFFRKKSGAAGRKEAEALNPQSEQLVGSNIKLSKEYFFIPYLLLIFTWILKNQVRKIKVDELDF